MPVSISGLNIQILSSASNFSDRQALSFEIDNDDDEDIDELISNVRVGINRTHFYGPLLERRMIHGEEQKRSVPRYPQD
jgi:hypothetical protein